MESDRGDAFAESVQNKMLPRGLRRTHWGWLTYGLASFVGFLILNIVLKENLKCIPIPLLLSMLPVYVNSRVAWLRDQLVDLASSLSPNLDDGQAFLTEFRSQVGFVFGPGATIALGIIVGVLTTASVAYLGVWYTSGILRVYFLALTLVAGLTLGMAMAVGLRFAVLPDRFFKIPSISQYVRDFRFPYRRSLPRTIGALCWKVGFMGTFYYILWVLAIWIAIWIGPYQMGTLLLLWLGVCLVMLLALFFAPQYFIHRHLVQLSRERVAVLREFVEAAEAAVFEKPDLENTALLINLRKVEAEIAQMGSWGISARSILVVVFGYVAPFALTFLGWLQRSN